jgi:hypothetical protein
MQNVLSSCIAPLPEHPLLNNVNSVNYLSANQMPLASSVYEYDDGLIHSPMEILPSSYDDAPFDNITAFHHGSTFKNKVETTTIAVSPFSENGPVGPLLYTPDPFDAGSGASPSRDFIDGQQPPHYPFGPLPDANAKGHPESRLESEGMHLRLKSDGTLDGWTNTEVDAGEDSPPYIIESSSWQNINDYRPLRRYLRRKRNNAQSRRNTHSQAEKDYRERLTAKFKELSAALESFPSGHGSSAEGVDSTQLLSKAEVLSLASHQLRTLRRERKVLLMELGKLTSLEQPHVAG